MTQRTTALRIAGPCPQSWAAMTPAATGRHCATCHKTVVDFTHKTDAEILATLRQATGAPCGRLRADQLGRPLMPPAPASPWHLWLSAMLAVGSALGVGKAAAQPSHFLGTKPNLLVASPGSATSIVARALDTKAAADEPIALQGTVRDASTGELLPGVLLLLKGTRLGSATDAAGSFTLPVQAETSRVTLIISCLGYETIEKTIRLKHRPGGLRLQLQLSHAVLGEIAYTNSPGGFFERLTSLFSRA
jgi:hypothetical protein